MDQWYCRSEKGETGPFSRDEIRYLVNSGVIPPTAELRDGLYSAWIHLTDSPFASGIESPRQRRASVIDVKPVSDLPSVETPIPQPALPKTLPEANRVTRFRNPNDLVAGLVVTALILLIAAVLLWLWRRPVSPGVGGNESTLAMADGSETGVDSTTTIGTDLNATDLGAPEAEGDTVVAGDGIDEPVAAVGNDGALPSNEEMPPGKDVAESASVPEPQKTSEDAFRIRLPTREELVDSTPDSRPAANKIPDDPPELQTSNLSGRSGEAKEVALRNSGGSVESEKAVALALQWLKSIQQRDGSWSFQQVGREAKNGSLDSPLAATSLAVLCFLGAGNTTKSGPEKEVVQRAFDFLSEHIRDGSSRRSDTMYVYALVTMAFAELAAMEPSEVDAKRSAQKLLSFIEESQDPHGGGWRYSPRQAGDLSVTGWQIMALQSGKTCGLSVPDKTVTQSHRFLDSTSFGSGTQYSYTPGNASSPCMTSVGLLSRIYLGWPRNTKPLRDGLQQLSHTGPDPNNIYLNYYATLALHHYGGEPWNTWNERLRPQLIESQIAKGAATGSWAVTDPHGHAGGQIYQTCLSVLCLEVYYRYLPMFNDGPEVP